MEKFIIEFLDTNNKKRRESTHIKVVNERDAANWAKKKFDVKKVISVEPLRKYAVID